MRRTYSIAFFLANIASDPEFFVTRSGLPKWVFRVAVDRDVWSQVLEEPNSKPGADFFTLECIGERWAQLQLQKGDLIAALCVPRSRDVEVDGQRRVVTYFRPIQIVVVHRKDAGAGDCPAEILEFVPGLDQLARLLDEVVRNGH